MAGKKASEKVPRKAIRSAAREDPAFRLESMDPEEHLVHVIVDTPMGSPIKFKYDVEKRCYKTSYLLPQGSVFPFDFGWIPGTLEEDGDALDVLVLMEKPSFVGCLVPVRLLGALEAEQTQEGKTFRNDRLVGAAEVSREYRDLASLESAPKKLVDDIQHFFVTYNEERGREFKIIRRTGPVGALRLVDASRRRFRRIVPKRRS